MPARHRRSLAWLLGLVAPLAQAGQGLPQDLQGLDAQEQARARASAEAVASRLPPLLRAALPATLQLRWEEGLPEDVHGRATAARIILARSLLQGDDAAAEHARQAALVHELVHVADRSGARWSSQPRLRDLAGWQRRPWHMGRSGNAFQDRSPDLYETRSPAEFLAVNAEYFLLDAGFACRRPALAQWYRTWLGEVPGQPAVACPAALPLLQAGEREGDASLLALDPARVYAVDYLFAEGSRAPMSRWGHSMLRLVVCRPGRPPGPDCRLDLQEHRVLSFRAFVGDVQLSNWRGLTGGYPSRLFVLPMQQVIDEYTKVELRGLASIPLRLSRDEIASLLERTAQVHWSYDGRYYFVSNNCAVETAKLLQAGVPRLGGAGLAQLTPRGLRGRLHRLGALDEGVLDDPVQARAQGYYFDSARTHYDQLFAVAAAQLRLPARDVEGWLSLPARTRQPWLTQGNLRASAGLLLLEQAAQRRAELRARDALKLELLRAPGSVPARELQGLLAQSGQWLRPASLVEGGGYGLPQGDEQARAAQAVALASADAVPAWQALRATLRARLPTRQQAELQAIDANLEVLGQRLREQAAEPAAR